MEFMDDGGGGSWRWWWMMEVLDDEVVEHINILTDGGDGAGSDGGIDGMLRMAVMV